MLLSDIKQVFMINLPSRQDRYYLLSRQLNKLGIAFEKVGGVISSSTGAIPSGELGCLLSHFFILKYAQHLKLENCLILEDDAKLLSIKDLEDLDIPEDWDMIYLGGNLNEAEELPTRINSRVFKCKNVRANHAIIIRDTAYVKLIETIGCNLDIDLEYIKAQEILNCYLIHPPLAIQRPGTSNIANCFMDFSKAQDRLNDY
jgi:hypothetical protein